MVKSDAEVVAVEATLARDLTALDTKEPSADTADRALELEQTLVDNDTIEVHAAVESDVMMAPVGMDTDTCGKIAGSGRVALVGRRPCRIDAVHCVAE